jgi:hypothetical protein
MTAQLRLLLNTSTRSGRRGGSCLAVVTGVPESRQIGAIIGVSVAAGRGAYLQLCPLASSGPRRIRADHASLPIPSADLAEETRRMAGDSTVGAELQRCPL